MSYTGDTRATIDAEARNIDKLRSIIPHKNVIRILQNGCLLSSTRPLISNVLPVYIIDMELGQLSLYDWIRRHYHSTPQIIPSSAKLWSIMTQIASGIAFMHSKNVIHRDLKPDNSTSQAYFVNIVSTSICVKSEPLENNRLWNISSNFRLCDGNPKLQRIRRIYTP